MVAHICQSGSRGLEVISLAECRNVTDVGAKRLGTCTLLRKVCFLGCAYLKDEGIVELVKQLPHLEEFDLGSTNITGVALSEMVAVCLNLKTVNITGCKKLNASDDLILKA